MSDETKPSVPKPRSIAPAADATTGASTRSVHAGDPRPAIAGAVPTPIVSSATFAFSSSSELRAFFSGDHPDPEREEYGRYGNPTTRALEERLAALELPSGGADAVCFSSGMAAIATAVMALTKQGAHVIAFDDGYRRTRQLLGKTLAAFGVEHTLVPPGDLNAVKAAIRPSTKLIVGESPTNPYLQVTDLRALTTLARAHRVKTLIDATFATPILCRPLELGADLVVHSATKYLAGHHDVLAGVVIGKPGVVSLVRELRGVLGGTLDPHAAFLVARGLKTLSLRVDRASASALAIARFLSSDPRVRAVFYPGLESHPGHAIAREQMRAFGGVVSFRVRAPEGVSDEDAAARVVDGFSIARIAPSLGGVDTLVEQPALMSFFDLTREERRAVGIDDDLIRLAVGVEDVEDLLRDVAHALSRLDHA